MALAANRTGVVLKKCAMSNHRPETVKLCAAGTCQHTCKPGTIEKCKHAVRAGAGFIVKNYDAGSAPVRPLGTGLPGTPRDRRKAPPPLLAEGAR